MNEKHAREYSSMQDSVQKPVIVTAQVVTPTVVSSTVIVPAGGGGVDVEAGGLLPPNDGSRDFKFQPCDRCCSCGSDCWMSWCCTWYVFSADAK